MIEINGMSTKDMTHADAIELIKQCGNAVTLLVKRGGKLPTHLDPMNPPNLGSPVGPPPPGTNIRSTATLPSASPNSGMPPYSNQFPPPPFTTHTMPHQMSTGGSGGGYPPSYPHNGMIRGPHPPPPPMHSSPSTQYHSPLTPNGPLGQSSPRVIAGDNYYWNRMPDQRPM